MHFDEIRQRVILILQDFEGDFLFPYQIFSKIKKENKDLGERIEREYHVDQGRPRMGEGAGIYYSPASFVAHALNKFMDDGEGRIVKEWFNPTDVAIDGIIPGNKETVSIWAWKE